MKSYPTLRKWIAGSASLAILGIVVLITSLSGNSALQDKAPAKPDPKYPWPMFGGTLDRNLVNLTDPLPKDFSVRKGKEKGVVWQAELGSKSYAGPVVAEGKVFVGTNNQKKTPRDPNVKGDQGLLQCFDEATGKFLYQINFPKLPAGRVNDWPYQGICSTPVVENGKIYFVSNQCQVVCASTKNGSFEEPDGWVLDMMKELRVFPHNIATCSPIIVDDLIFVCTSNGVDEGHINIPQPTAPSFIAVNKNTGKVVWQNNDPTVKLTEFEGKGDREKFIKKLVDSGQLAMHGQWANPCYAEVNGVKQVIFPGGDGWLRAFDPKGGGNPNGGKVLWKFDCNPKDSFYVLGSKATRNDFVNTPVVYNNKLYIGVGQDPEHQEGVGHFWCIDLVKATKFGGDVSPKDKEFDPKAKANEKSALHWHYGGEGDKKDRIPGFNYVFGRTLSTACVHNDIVYIPDLGGVLYAFEADTGKKLWAYETFSPVWASPYFVDGKLLLGTDAKSLYIFDAGRELKEPQQVRFGARLRATPVVANGTLYVMSENTLYAIR